MFKTIKNLWRAWRKRNTYTQLAIHQRSLTKLPAFLAVPILCGHAKGKLHCPSDVTIVLMHNYSNLPIAEKSLRYVGIKNYVVLKPTIRGPWYNSIKLRELDKYLESGRCNSEFILYLDSDDVVLRDTPRRAVDYMKLMDCDLLMSSTHFTGGYECMSDVRQWADALAETSGHRQIYLNSGVYVGRTTFIHEVVKAGLKYINGQDLNRSQYRDLRRKGTLCEHLPDFPSGIGCDQVIFRYLHPQFYPRMKIDYLGQLALR